MQAKETQLLGDQQLSDLMSTKSCWNQTVGKLSITFPINSRP